MEHPVSYSKTPRCKQDCYYNIVITADVNSTQRLFADDSILYWEIKNSSDQTILQDDLNKVFC